MLGLPLAACLKSGDFRVIGVTDGDTVRVLDSSYTQFTVRLAGIDAPEHDQPFGRRSRGSLATLVYGKAVRLHCQKEESYGRKVCSVFLLNGEDVCLDQVRAGMAWHYKQFEGEQSPQQRASYAAAEDAARAAHIGLWSQPDPIPPWVFRHQESPQLCFNGTNRIACSSRYQGPVRGNRRTRIYQWPGCPYYEAISLRNRVDFASAQDAEHLGYRPAYNCP